MFGWSPRARLSSFLGRHDLLVKQHSRSFKGSVSTSVLCGRRVVWRGPFSLISKLQLSKSWLFLKIFCACERFTVRCVKTSLHHRTSLCICVFFYWIKFVPKKKTILLWSDRMSDLLRNLVGRQRMKKKPRRFCCDRALCNFWNQKKIDLGFQGNTNSEFAEFLLHSPMAIWTRKREKIMDDGAEGKKNRAAANSKWFVLRWR